MERERIDNIGARVWCPKSRVVTDSIPQISPIKRRGRDRLNQATVEGKNVAFIRSGD
jgi:hypothetical protein